MGGTVGIEAARMEDLDYETVKASGLAFGTAHNVLQRSLTKSKSVNVSNDQTTIHFLAIRQLSHNLKNQKTLEKAHKKVIKTKSVPHNVKYKQHSFQDVERDFEHEHEHEQELDHDDLHLVHDEEYYAHHDNFHSQIVDDGPPWSFSEKEKNGFHAHEHENGHTLTGPNPSLVHRDLSSNRTSTDNTTTVSSGTATTVSKTSPVPIAKPKRGRPNLSLQLTSEVSNNALPVDSTISNNTGFQPHKLAQMKQYHNSHHDDAGEVGVVGASGQPLKHPPSPSANVRVSPRGTLYMGKWKVMETGIFPDESAFAQSLRNRVHHQGSIGSHLTKSHTYSRGLGSSSSNLQRTGSVANGSIRRPAPLPAIGGKRDFLEINTLGSGASGVVTEAIHLPSLTIVALKMLPVYNQEKRQHVSRELGVLYKNLAELRLVDDSLYEDKSADQQQQEKQLKEAGGAAGGLGGVSSPHILSLYNAFVDPKSGMINLVIEYMDGGSLEDLVQQGGCRDEKVLADIAYQTIKGLCFLHSHKSVHRDIKPANILCSTSGLIKIGDFGISKALDKTTGFANSFVGTVSYMSPERITGEHYSFSSDIWSLGLTILAVAKGRFPLSSHADSDGDSGTLSEKSSPLAQKIVGGAAGYWAMIKAICDDEPPVAGPSFSAEFNSFIANCLQKDPAERSSAKGLLSLPFIEDNTSSLKLSYSDMQMRHSSMSVGQSNHMASAITSPSTAADAKVSPGSSDARNSASPVKLEVDVNCSPAEGNSIPPAPSPLTTRLTNAAIVRRTSQDVPVFDSPTNLMHKAITEAAEQRALLESSSGKDANFNGIGLSVNGTIREDVDEENEVEGMQYIDGEQRAMDVINSIRLEHLDRVLDRIAHKLESRHRRAHRNGGAGGGGEEEGEDEDESDEYDDTHERDLTDIHHYVDDFAAAKDEQLGETNTSLDSLDRMLQHKGTGFVAATAEPSPPPTLMLPAHKFGAKKQAAAVAMTSPVAPEVDEVADAKPESAVAEAKLIGHKGVKGVSPDPSPESQHRRDEIKKAQEASSGDEKFPLHHSILKGTPSYNASHPLGSHIPLHAIMNGMHVDSPVAADDGLMRAEDKKAIFVAHKARSGGPSAFSSNRSVHFNEEDDPLLIGTKKATLTHHQRPSFVLEGEGEAESAEIEKEERERDAESDASHPHLPKTSSYFVQSRSHLSSHGHTAEGGEAKGVETDNRSVVEKAIAVSEAVALEDIPPALPVDYCRMLPKLNSRGLPKWENLAKQLHLPLHLVKLAVRSRLGDLVNLEDEEEEEGEEEGEEEYELDGNAAGGRRHEINALIEDDRELMSERDSPAEEHPLEAEEQQSGSHHK